jgi:hypothetical protein
MLLLLLLSCSASPTWLPGEVTDVDSGQRFLTIDRALDSGARRLRLGAGSFALPCGELRLDRLVVVGAGEGSTRLRPGQCDQLDVTSTGPIVLSHLTLYNAGAYLSGLSTVTIEAVEITGWTGGEDRQALRVNASRGYFVSDVTVHGNAFGYGDGLTFLSRGEIDHLEFHDNTLTEGYLLYVHEGVLRDSRFERNVRTETHPGLDLVEVYNTDLFQVSFSENRLNGPSLRLMGAGDVRHLSIEDDRSAWMASLRLDPEADYRLEHSQIESSDGVAMEPGSRLSLVDVWMSDNGACDIRCDNQCVDETDYVECAYEL